MLKAAIEKIVELAHPSVIDVDGRKFSTGEFEEVRPLKFYPKYLPLTGLDSVVKMTREEAVPTYPDKKIYVQVSGHNTVSVFTEYDEEKRRACELSVAGGADFVKTSTGFSTGGATTADITLMRETVGPELGVKASGGIRTLEAAIAMIEAGATRLGVSAAVSILEEVNE